MFRFFLGCLSVAAIGLMVSQAIAGGNTANLGNNANANPNPNNNGGVVIIETMSSSSVVQPMNTNNNDMQPLPNNPGVEVAPVEAQGSSVVMPVMVEEGVMIEQTGNGN